MNDDASGAPMGTPAPAAPFGLRRVPPATAAERLTREEGMARALRFGATPYRDAEDKGRYVLFKEANLAPVEPWVRDPRNKRRYRRVQEVRKAAGQLVGQPGDRIEIAKRLGVLHWEDGSDIEGAAARGLYDAIWSREHVYDSFTVPRRYGRSLMETGRVAAVAEEEARKLQAEDPKASGGFWVRMRNDLGLVYVVSNVDPEAEGEEEEHPAPPILAAAGADDEVVSGPVEQDIFVGSEPRDPSDVPLLRDEGDIVTFIVERQSLDGGVFRQEAFEAGLDPDRAEFFRDLLRGTAEDREALLQRAGSLFTQWELWNSVQGAIPTVLATDDPEARKSIVRGAARYARPHDEKEARKLAAVPGLQRRRRSLGGGRGLKHRFVLPPQERGISWNRELAAPERRSFPEMGTALYSVPNQPVAKWVQRNGRPLGFKTSGEFRAFTDLLHGTVSKLDPNARIAMRGSAVNGLSYDKKAKAFSGIFFDMKVERASDFDIAIVSPELLRVAREKGIPVLPRNGGLRTGALKDNERFKKLGLGDILDRLQELTGREDISFMIYESVEQLERRGTTMFLR